MGGLVPVIVHSILIPNTAQQVFVAPAGVSIPTTDCVCVVDLTNDRILHISDGENSQMFAFAVHNIVVTFAARPRTDVIASDCC